MKKNVMYRISNMTPHLFRMHLLHVEFSTHGIYIMLHMQHITIYTITYKFIYCIVGCYTQCYYKEYYSTLMLNPLIIVQYNLRMRILYETNFINLEIKSIKLFDYYLVTGSEEKHCLFFLDI